MTLAFEVIRPADRRPPRQMIVLLHGGNSNHGGMSDLAAQIGDALPGALLVLPDAPFKSDFHPDDPAMRQWFSMAAFREKGRDRTQLLPDMRESHTELDALLDDLLVEHRLKESRLVLGGFSQGGMMSLYTGLHRARPIAGVICFSGMLVEDGNPAHWSKLPIYMYHGELDEAVLVDEYRQSLMTLKDCGFTPRAIEMPGIGHSIEPPGVKGAINFMADVLFPNLDLFGKPPAPFL